MDLIVEFAPGHRGKSKEELSKILDAEVERFSEYMASIADDRARGQLAPFEKALVKSYLVFRAKENG